MSNYLPYVDSINLEGIGYVKEGSIFILIWLLTFIEENYICLVIKIKSWIQLPKLKASNAIGFLTTNQQINLLPTKKYKVQPTTPMVREKIANQNDLTNVVFLDHIV
jgi:hypothetical protein